MELGLTTARRGEVFLIDLNPTTGGEMQKTRPGLVVSPDELNRHSRTVLIAPMTTGSHPYPFRVSCRFGDKSGHVVTDQIRAVDSTRLLRRLGEIDPTTLSSALAVLQEMFAE
jgi:mRNA interferase MazF